MLKKLIILIISDVYAIVLLFHFLMFHVVLSASHETCCPLLSILAKCANKLEQKVKLA